MEELFGRIDLIVGEGLSKPMKVSGLRFYAYQLHIPSLRTGSRGSSDRPAAVAGACFNEREVVFGRHDRLQ